MPCSTALLVIHGIGNQQPYETLDDFARGMLAVYTAGGVDRVRARHEVTLDEDSDGRIQRRSFLRLERPGSPHFLDLHEYYWAPETEGAASLGDIQRWLRGVASEAGRFYRDQVEVALEAGDESPFFTRRKDPATGRVTAVFNLRRYQIFLQAVGLLIPAGARIAEWLIEMVRRVPLLGPALGKWLDRVQESKTHELANVVGDITVYNTMDARSPQFEVRGRIRAGAVRSLRHLVAAERRPEDGAWGWTYERVVVAGHSLGSQVAFDALNGLLDLAGEGRLDGFTADGNCVVPAEAPHAPRFRTLGELIGGFVTFGSPLDKIAFFLSDRTPPEHYFLRQIRRQAFSFKQRALSLTASTACVLSAPRRPLLDDVAWINFHDNNDYVSGSLDFYQRVVNLNCGFPARLGAGPLRAIIWGWRAWAAVAVLFLLGSLGGFALNLLAEWSPGLRDSWAAAVIEPTLFSWLYKLVTTPLGAWFTAAGGQSLASLFGNFLPFWLWLVATFLLVTATAWYAGLNFTHSKYWSHPPMYAALIRQMLQRDPPATHDLVCRDLGACAPDPHAG
ncbi:MAG: hypothetical protein ACKVYV_11055 [Limisphaerales bacterium]